MSAIAGILCFGHDRTEAGPAERMAAHLAWRGPDDDGSYRSPDGRVALAARRLALVDDSAEAGLPLANETHDVWLVLDGAVLNHRGLRHTLELIGHRFRSGSDSEVALHAYEQWGLEFLDHLQGGFALALWDDRRDRLVLARDRMGGKPLYIAQDRNRLGFASAIAPLLAEMGLPRRLDPIGLAQHLARGWVEAPRTLVAGIAKLGAGEMLVAERGGQPLRKAWGSALPDERRVAGSRRLGIDRQAGTLRTLLECAVADRMMGDGPAGIRLGPSLASATIGAVMSRLTGRPAQAIAVHAADCPDGTEARTLRRLAAAARCELTEVAICGDEAAASVTQLAACLSEPVAEPQALAAWVAARTADRIGLSALLAGDGAGEVLLLHPAYDRVRRAARFKRFCPWLPWSGLTAGPTAAAPFGDTEWPGLFAPPPAPPSPTPVPAWLAGDSLGAAGWADLAGRGAEWLCVVADSTALAHGVHCRLPFLDETLLAHVLAIPGATRAAAPRQMIYRLFGDLSPYPAAPCSDALPLDRWMAGPLGDMVERAIAGAGLFGGGIVSAAAARALLAEHRQGIVRTHSLWALLILAEWCQALGLDTVAESEAMAHSRL